MTTINDLRSAAMRSWRPPPVMDLSTWVERFLVLPSDVSSLPGKVKLSPQQRGICSAISNPLFERVSILKGVRVGFSTLLTATIANFVANDPCPILVVLPTEADARDVMVSDVEPTFASTPAVAGALTVERHDLLDRNTLLSRRFPGGNLRVVAAKAPRNLRRFNIRILLLDEIDEFESDSGQGDVLRLAERRTLSFSNRKIICGSTPVSVESSYIMRAYESGDQRIFECMCPSCNGFSEVRWCDIRWDEKPETARWVCPSCGTFHGEEHKPAMVNNGKWTITKPEIKGHASFKLTALTSLLPNCAWPVLAKEFCDAKHDADRGDTSALQTFINTILAEPWSGPGETVPNDFATMMEPYNIDNMPPVALYLFAGVDCQIDRLEVSICGFDPENVCHVLSHQRIWGSMDDSETWSQLSQLLSHRWKHPWGGSATISAAAIDSGFATEQVYNYCFPRTGSRIYAIKGLHGNRVAMVRSTDKVIRGKSTRNSGYLWLVGTFTLKMMLFRRMQSGKMLKFSADLDEDYFEQLTSEKITYVYRSGRRAPKFEKISGRNNECFDCLVYAHAARASYTISDWKQREEELRSGHRPASRPQQLPIAGWDQATWPNRQGG